MKIFYKPTAFYLIVDLFILFLSYYVVLDWFPLTTDTPFEKYSIPILLYTLAWILVSYLFNRYRALSKHSYFKRVLSLFYTCLILFVGFWLILHNLFKPYSGYVLLTITAGVFVVNYIFTSIYYAYRFAVEYNEVTLDEPKARVNAKVKPTAAIDDKSYEQLCSVIQNHSKGCVLEFLQMNANLKSGNTKVFINTGHEDIMLYPNYQYSTIIQLERLNNMRKISQKFSVINEKLADDGIFICCFESKSTRKMQMLKKYPLGLNYIFYSIDFFYTRIMPKVFITRNLYYAMSHGKNRILSKTEVLGRLYCFGFEVVKERKVDHLNYVIARRIKQPEKAYKRIYGPLIRLKRYGKNRKMFEVYKMRTMHPYSEYLQAYIHKKNSLKEGGKFNKDIRVTSVGGFMRRYWIDELPMILNLLKGDMKLVGVRPLSAHYFSLYSKELQELRTKFRPGLLPPFYADMPKTLDDIQLSEMNYLQACEKDGVVITDIKYLFKIMKNIFFKRARSA